MIVDILNKILILAFFMSCLSVLRHGYYFMQAFLTSSEEEPVKYRISKTALVLLCVSMSYILTVILTGINI